MNNDSEVTSRVETITFKRQSRMVRLETPNEELKVWVHEAKTLDIVRLKMVHMLKADFYTRLSAVHEFKQSIKPQGFFDWLFRRPQNVTITVSAHEVLQDAPEHNYDYVKMMDWENARIEWETKK